MLSIRAMLFLAMFVQGCGQQGQDSDFDNPHAHRENASSYLNLDDGQPDQVLEQFELVELGVITADEDNLEPSTTQLTHFVNHPITLSYKIKALGEAFSTVLFFGIVEKAAQDATAEQLRDLKVCSLGSVKVQHGGSDDDGNATTTSYRETFIIPDQCLAGASEGVFNILVGFDQLGELDFSDTSMNSGMVTVFNDQESASTINQKCLTRSGTPGCVVDITVKSSPGLNIAMTDFKVESSVGLIRPTVAGHESSLVTDGKDEHDTPFLQVDTEITLYGAATDVEDGLDGDKQVTIQYDICPAADASDSTTNCVGDTWLALSIFNPDLPNSPNGHLGSAIEGALRAHEPTHFNHDLYLEQDLYTVMTQGIWRNHTHFVVRACARANFEEAVSQNQAGNQVLPDHCRTTTIKVIQIPSQGTNPGDSSLSLSKIWENTFGSKRHFGLVAEIKTQSYIDRNYGSNFELKAELSTDGWVTLKLIGLELTANARLPNTDDSGMLIKFLLFGLPLAYTPVGATSTSSADEPTTDDLGSDGVLNTLKDLALTLCPPDAIPIPLIPISLKLCLKGGAGFDIKFGVLSKGISEGDNDLFPTATSLGAIVGKFSPNAAITMSLEAGASIFGLKLGVKGKADVAKISLPTSPFIYWGRDAANARLGLKLVIDTSLVLSTLDGSFGVQFPVKSLFAGCFFRGLFGRTSPYSCQTTTFTHYQPIVKWKGLAYNLNLMHRTISSLTLGL